MSTAERGRTEGRDMPIVDSRWALMNTPGGEGSGSTSVTWRFPREVTINAQAAINGVGFSDGYNAWVGFSAYVQRGQYHTIPAWTGVLFMDGVTEVEISAWSFDGWVLAGAMGLVWS
jgi:hypothetical protein